VKKLVTGLSIGLVIGASQQVFAQASVEKGKSVAIEIPVDSDTACNIEVTRGGEKTNVRVDPKSKKGIYEFAGRELGEETIRWEGKMKFRGLKTLGPCRGDGSIKVVTTESAEAIEAAKQAQKAEEEAKQAKAAMDAQAARLAELEAKLKAAEAAAAKTPEQKAEEARVAAEAKAYAEAKVAAELKAAAEEKALAEARAAAEAKAAAEARAAAEIRAAAEAKAAAEARAAEEARAAQEAKAAAEAREQAERRAAQQRQELFVKAVQRAQSGSASAKNKMQKGALLAERTKAICSILRNTKVDNWRGKITQISANSDGKGVLKIEIGPDVFVKTWNNSFSDGRDKTLLEPGSPLFNKVANMDTNTKVVFSGYFLIDRKNCIKESSLSLDGKLKDPEFIFRFTDVQN
jgi:hypothetical protein